MSLLSLAALNLYQKCLRTLFTQTRVASFQFIMYFVHWAIWCHHISVWSSRVGRQYTLTRQFYLFINITRTPSSASGLSCEPFYITIFPSADLYVERVFIRETYLSCSYTSNKPGLPLVNCLLQGWPAFVLSTKKMGLKGEKNMSKTLRRLWRKSVSYAGKATKTIPIFFWFKYQSGLALGQSFQFIWKNLSKVQKFDWSVPPQNLINLDQIITGVVNCEHPKYFSMEIPANL